MRSSNAGFFLFFFLFIGISPFGGFASPETYLRSGDAVAKELLNGMGEVKKSAESHPFYTRIPSESALSASELKGKAQSLSVKDPAGKMVYESSESRTQFKIDLQKDPLLGEAQKITENSLEVIGGKGTKIVKSESKGETETATCEEAGDESLESCVKELTVKVVKTKVRRELKSAFQISKCSNCEKHGHYLPCMALRNSFYAAYRAFGRWALFYSGKNKNFDAKGTLNITESYKACMAEVAKYKNKPFGCRECMVSLPPLTFNSSQIKEVSLELHPHNSQKLYMHYERSHTYNSGRHEYHYQPSIKITYEEDSYTISPDEWTSNCSRLEEKVDKGLCSYDSKACSQGKQTKTINGVPITRDCWEEAYTYSCAYPAKNDCGPLRARGCAQTSSTCKEKIGNTCVVYTQAYQCKGNGTNTESITGGNTPFCLDGSCRDQSWERNDEMMSTLAQMSLLKEMQGKLQNNTLFKGEDNRCSKCILSFKDCCGSGKGWGKSIGLTDCSSEERVLKQKRNANLCHYVGTYCSKKVLSVCTQKKSTFCCFGSKLVKAFHEQGRAQINLGWGDAKEPVCRGFTVEELQKIDFSKLDLSEIYEDLMKNFKPNKMNDLGKKVGERLEIIQKAIDPKKKQFKQRDEG
jgi:type-F conjugative transfer system mating-pair stabilization protein TraN